jgi:hypothetical protein
LVVCLQRRTVPQKDTHSTWLPRWQHEGGSSFAHSDPNFLERLYSSPPHHHQRPGVPEEFQPVSGAMAKHSAPNHVPYSIISEQAECCKCSNVNTVLNSILFK